MSTVGLVPTDCAELGHVGRRVETWDNCPAEPARVSAGVTLSRRTLKCTAGISRRAAAVDELTTAGIWQIGMESPSTNSRLLNRLISFHS
jgi:hypothetical protein